MADIFHHFSINAPAHKVFQGISTPAGLDAWWTKRSSGEPREGAEYELYFGPGFAWRALVSRCIPDSEFEFRMKSTQQDWEDTRVLFSLRENNGVTQVRFTHSGWPEANEHHRTSCYCWAMYLRLLKRYVERGEVIAYEDRLEA